MGEPGHCPQDRQIYWDCHCSKLRQKNILLSELVPEYATKYSKVFEKHAAERFPPSRPWDHAITFKKEFEQENAHKDKRWSRIYPLSLTEKEQLQKFIDKNLAKGFI